MSLGRNSVLLSKLVVNYSRIVSILPENLCSRRVISQSKLLSRSYSQLLKCRSSLNNVFSVASSNSFHTKGDKELAEFLEQEIKAEVKSRKSSKLPTIEGFDIKTDGAEVTMSKQFNNENITVKMNINQSVDAEEPQFHPNQDSEPPAGEMKSKPNFTVEIEKNGKKLAFSCSFSEAMGEETDGGDPQDSYNDAFQITEFTIYTKEWEDETYTVSGDIMDGYLYDLLMNMLEDRGIGNEFADLLVEYCTSYEHSKYVGLLEELKEFVSTK
ncbi:complement component 1 Q subcomponent-binding protein, mitochondrial-like [Centruroides vittatus]|uniref:complement component 1 Q subcomponent-binding protein, mitochondrial-like n=1 Tax=Centruroides vittatus TaxID=120091 RepID=UPI00350ED411